MSQPEIRSFEDFWPYYVRAHSKLATRRWHAVGTASALACLVTFAATRRARWLALAPVLGYGAAWYSHFFIEGNKPATFGHPLWSLRGDFEMLTRMITGTMDAEVERCCAAAEPVATEVPTTQQGTNGHAPDRTLH
jgi:hypothetical protein